MFRKGRKKKLDLILPAMDRPVLGASPSVRIMAVANKRAIAYGFLFAALLSIAFNILFAVLMFSRIDMIPYVADGSSYGCSPKVMDDATTPISQQTPQKSASSGFIQLNADIEGDN